MFTGQFIHEVQFSGHGYYDLVITWFIDFRAGWKKDVPTLVTWHCVEKRTLAKGADSPLSSAAIRPRPWYTWHRSWKYLLSAERESEGGRGRGLPSADQNSVFTAGCGQLTHPGRTSWQEVSSSLGGSAYCAPHPPLHKLAETLLANCWWPLYCTWPDQAICRPPASQRSHLMHSLETGETEEWDRINITGPSHTLKVSF